MRIRVTLSILALCLVAGCGPTTGRLIYKEGATAMSKQPDLDECKIESFKAIPQTIAQHVTPGFSSPGTTYCSGTGYLVSCNTYGGVNIPPTVRNYDVNAGLRDRFIQKCLNQKGYQIVELPFCDGSDGYNNNLPAPLLSQIKCLNRNSFYMLK